MALQLNCYKKNEKRKEKEGCFRAEIRKKNN